METENKNLELWHKVEKTNPAYTKNANVRGNKITSISPQYQIKNVTEQFGEYGKNWGFKKTTIDYTLASEFGMVVLDAEFFYPGGQFNIKNSIGLFIDNSKTKIDVDFAKKLETDTLTKAISKLGFNADIFMGKFDDVRYVEEMKEEFASPEEKAKKEAELKEQERLNNIALDIASFEDVEKLGEYFKKLTPNDQKLFSKQTTEKKNSLTPKQ